MGRTDRIMTMTSAHRAYWFASNSWLNFEITRKWQQPLKFRREYIIVKRFSRYAKVFTVVGCFFIRSLSGTALEQEPRVIWRSWYTAYSVLCFMLMLILESWAVYARFSHLDFNVMFTEALLSTLQLCLVLKVIVNFTCMTVGTTRFLEFFRKAILFETSVGISYLLQTPPTRCTWLRTLRRLGAAVTVLATFAGSLNLIVQIFLAASNYTSASEVVKLVFRMLSQIAFGIYDTSMCIVLSTLSEVLVLYVKSQLVALRKIEQYIRGARIDGLSAALMVENIRRNVCSVKELKNCISRIWAPSIVAFSLCTMWVHCITLYCLFIGHGNHVDLWLGLAYSLHCALTLLDLAVLSDDLRTEAQNIRNVAANAAMLHSEDAYSRQIQFLHDSIDPDGMRLTGANFFHLDRGLLVTMAGSIITYTVILVQTSDGLSARNSGT